MGSVQWGLTSYNSYDIKNSYKKKKSRAFCLVYSKHSVNMTCYHSLLLVKGGCLEKVALSCTVIWQRYKEKARS